MPFVVEFLDLKILKGALDFDAYPRVKCTKEGPTPAFKPISKACSGIMFRHDTVSSRKHYQKLVLKKVLVPFMKS